MKAITESELKKIIKDAYYEGFKAASDVLAELVKDKFHSLESDQSSRDREDV